MAVLKTDWANGQQYTAAAANAVGTQVNQNTTDIAGKQPADADLTAVANLAPANDDVLQRKGGVWTNRTPAQLKADLAIEDPTLESIDGLQEALDEAVQKTGNQTIAGDKTFTGDTQTRNLTVVNNPGDTARVVLTNDVANQTYEFGVNTGGTWSIWDTTHSKGPLKVLEDSGDGALTIAPGANYMEQPLDMDGNAITSVADPTTAQGVATKGYVDGEASKTALASFMKPSSTTLYPSSDVVSYTVSATDPAYSWQRQYHFKDADIDQRWRYSGVWFDYANNPVNQISGAGEPGDFNNSTSYEVEFYANGTDVTLWLRSAALTDFKVFVDDAPIKTGWDLTTAGAFDHNYVRLQFATSRVRKIRLLASGFIAFTAVLTPGASSIWKANPRFRVAITGDSYIQGGHYLGPLGHLMGAGLANQLAILTGWEVLNLGQGGTGYVNDSEGTIGKSPYGSTSRLAALAALPELDLFIAFGSGNDSGTATGTVLTAANNMWNAVKTARPETPIVVVGVQSGTPTGFDPTLMSTLNTALIASASANANVAGVIDMRTDPWWTGTGDEGTPEDDGNQDFFMSADEVHPSLAGYENLADRMAAELADIRV